MPKVTILPLDRVIEAADDATIMEAAHEHGLYWPTTCGGEGICTSCACTTPFVPNRRANRVSDSSRR